MLRNNVSRFSTAIKYTAERKFEGKNTETQYTFILVLLSHYYFLVLLCTFKQFYWFIFLVISVWIPTKKVRRRQIRSFGCFFFQTISRLDAFNRKKSSKNIAFGCHVAILSHTDATNEKKKLENYWKHYSFI